MAQNLVDSLVYTPVELSFGTSGLRGLVTDMTDLECYINTLGFLEFLAATKQGSDTIYVAGDLRESTPRILSAVLAAIQEKGLEVVYFGLIPTPTLALKALIDCVPCVMVTGSHIPADRNGIKFYKADGEVLKSDEVAIKAAVADVRTQIYTEAAEASRFNAQGMLREAVIIPAPQSGATDVYETNFTDVFADKPFAGKKVVVYQHSAVGRDLLVDLLVKLGAEVVAEGRSDVFVPIDTENVTPADQGYFLQLAAKHPDAFAIVSTDGDSDRPFMIDERGVFHRGDELGAIVADAFDADFAALPISANDNIDSFLAEKRVPYVHTRIGSPYVIVAMQEAEARGASRIVGWEVNGGFLLGSDIPFASGVLHRLPTRDAFLPLFVTIYHAIQAGVSTSELFKKLPARFTQAGLIDDFPVEISQKIVTAFSGEAAAKLIEQYFNANNNFGNVTDINTLDGVRITFDSGDIAHLRPSGNAPQLRIYSVANSQERADEIVALAIAKPNGIFSQLATDLK